MHSYELLTFSCENTKEVHGYDPVETLVKGIGSEAEWLYQEIRFTDYADDRQLKDEGGENRQILKIRR